jgi:hypothetical protein
VRSFSRLLIKKIPVIEFGLSPPKGLLSTSIRTHYHHYPQINAAWQWKPCIFWIVCPFWLKNESYSKKPAKQR